MALKVPTPTVKQLADFCLDYLARNPEQLAEFMVQSGIDPRSLRGLIGTDSFAHGLIDYVVSNEALLIAIAAENTLSPEAVTRVWAKLHHTEH